MCICNIYIYIYMYIYIYIYICISLCQSLCRPIDGLADAKLGKFEEVEVVGWVGKW